MKVALIQAEVSDTPFPPIGILYIAAVLEKAEIEVQVYHVARDEDTFLDKLQSFNPQLIGYSTTTAQYFRVKKLVPEIRRLIPDAFQVAGGVHPTVKPEASLADLDVDMVVVGEGEHTLLELLENLPLSDGFKKIPGLCFSKNGKIIRTANRPLIEDLSQIPFPAWHLIEMGKYLRIPGLIRGQVHTRTAAVITGRGCPFKCIFCNSPNLFEGRVRRRSVDNVIKEIQHLEENYHIDSVFFPDETFTLNPKWTYEFCQALQNNKINLDWACQARVDTVNPELLKKMKASGCVQVEFGVESGSEKVLAVLKKGIKPEQVQKAFAMAKAAGLRTLATFMLGNPSEYQEDIKATKKLALQIKSSYTSFFFTVPFPGTELHDLAIKEGWLDKEHSYDENWFIRQADYPLMEINFSKEKLSRIRANLQNRFLWRNYYGYLTSGKFLGKIIITVISKPKIIWDGLKVWIKTRRLDHFLEIIFTAYEKRYRNLSK